MRIALVSPYSWTYPGGVTRHIEALAEQLLAEGHHVRVLAPFDPPDRLSRPAAPRRAPAGPRGCPSTSSPLGRTVGFPANGAVSNLASRRSAVADAAPRARTPATSTSSTSTSRSPRWSAGTRCSSTARRSSAPSTCYSTNACRTTSPNAARRARAGCNRLHGRIAVSEAAAWTGAALLRRPLPRSSPTASTLPDEPPSRRARRRPAAHRLRRPGRRAQGPAACCCAPSRRCATTSPPS